MNRRNPSLITRRIGTAVIAALAAGAIATIPALRPAVAAADAAPQSAPVADAPAEGDEGTIPTKSLWDMVVAGGPLMIPLGGCSVVLLIFVFERMINLRRGRIIPGPFVKRFLHQLREGQLEREQGLELCGDSGSPVARIFAAALRKWGRPAVEVEQAVLDAGERAVHGLRRYLRVFNGLHTVSPLLGLFGTVLGIIQTFNEIATANAMGRPELLASGISEALLTTAAGLTVAIPSLILYLFFVSRVDQLTTEMDVLAQEVVSMVSAEGLQEAALPKNAHNARRVAAA